MMPHETMIIIAMIVIAVVLPVMYYFIKWGQRQNEILYQAQQDFDREIARLEKEYRRDQHNRTRTIRKQ